MTRMSRRLFDFKCRTCGADFEGFVYQDQKELPCVDNECRGLADRQITGTRLDPRLGVDATSFPTLGDKWARTRIQRKKIEEKHAKEHGITPSSAGADIRR